jgi:hypothetical protein
MVYFMSKLNWLFLKKPQISRHSRGEVETGITPNGADNPLRAGPKTLANLEPTREGNWGPGGVGDVLFRPNPPYPLPCEGRGKIWRGSPPRRGKTPANPQPTGVGKGGPGGRSPHGGGLWGVSPHENLKGGGGQPLQPRHEWDPKRRRTLSPRGWANRGVQGGEAPVAGGCGGCPPTKT